MSAIDTGYRDPAVANMLASLGSTADAGSAKGAAMQSAGGPVANIQAALQQINQIVAQLGGLVQGAAAQSQGMGPAAAPAGAGGPAMAGAPGAPPAAGAPSPLQQVINSVLAYAATLQPQTASPLPPGAQAAPAGAPPMAPAPAAAPAAPPAAPPMARQSAPQAGPPAAGMQATLKPSAGSKTDAPAMSSEQAMRVLVDNFSEIQTSDHGIKLDDLKKIANGETVNGMKGAPSPELRQAAKTFAGNPDAFTTAETLAQKTSGDKGAKADGILGLEDISHNVNQAKTLGEGEKAALQTLDTYKDKLFKDGSMDMSVLQSVAETGKLPDGNAAPDDLKAAAQRVTSSPWLMTKLDTGKQTADGNFDARANGDVSKGDLDALLKRASDVSVGQSNPDFKAKGAEGKSKTDAAGDGTKLDKTAVADLVKAAKTAFGDEAKTVLEAAAKGGDNLEGKVKEAVGPLIEAAKETFGDEKTAKLYLAAAAKAL
jgi:hypothetical protein